MIRLSTNCKNWVVLILLIFFCISTVDAAKGSKRQTETLTLENGLDVLLISDPDVHRGAAALSVGAGYLYDPEEKQGLAHYLEHMLFLGTKKYPEVGSYNKFLDEHSGSSNAYTSGGFTNYFFEVSHDGIKEALGRFSDFFKAPLFDKTYSLREIKAVNNEHEKNKLDDIWRGGFVQNLMSEPGHPITKFGTGNQETLSGDNSADLLKFYKDFYAASNMKLALISSLPMETMANLVREFFSDIPNHTVKLPYVSPDFRNPLQGQYRFLKIKTIKDIRSLEITFPTIRLIDYKESKPALIVGSVLGHEGRGSLLSKLKEEGLALELFAGGGNLHPNINSFAITISLTAKGLEEYKKVLRLVFAYIQKIKEKGIQEYTFKENQTMAQIDFDWKNPDEGMNFAAGKAAEMQDYKLEEMETLPYLITKYEPEAYKAILDTLIPENAQVILSYNSADTDQVALYYDAEYSFEKTGGEGFDDLKKPLKDNDMSYPDENKFIPYHMELTEEIPYLVRDDKTAKVWFKFDNRFEQPKVFLTFRIETPLVYKSPRDFELAKLYEMAVREGLNELVYPIQMAGLTYTLGIEKKGVVLTIGGYSERIEDLLRLVTKNLTEIKIDEQKFSNIKEAMILDLKNQKLAKAYARGGYYNRLMWLKKQYTEEEELSALSPLTLNDIHTYAGKLYEKVYITGMVHGNWTGKKAEESVSLIFNALKSRPLPEKERFEEVVEVLEPGEHIRFTQEVEDNNNSLAYAIQVGEKDFDLQAKTSMVASIIENDFYTQMRTNQQLGYIVWSFQQLVENRIFLRLVIQSSTHGPFEMSKLVNFWLLDAKDLFDNLTEDEFERFRQGLIISLEKEEDSINGAHAVLYAMATEEKGDFLIKSKLIKAVKNLKKEEVVKTARELFLNPETPRIEVLMRAKGSVEPVPDGTITDVSQFNNRKKLQIIN